MARAFLFERYWIENMQQMAFQSLLAHMLISELAHCTMLHCRLRTSADVAAKFLIDLAFSGVLSGPDMVHSAREGLWLWERELTCKVLAASVF